MQKSNSSYKQIFNSLGFVGGSQILVIIIGIVKTKIIAILLGPVGVGISGVFQNIIDLVRNATSFGINYSGVKKIADISDDSISYNVSKTITILRRWAIGTGLLGMLLMIIFSNHFSVSSFSTNNHKYDIIALSVVILLSSISAGQIALLQGLRKIKSMAGASVFGALFGTLITLPLYWIFGLNGIVYAIILNALITLGVSWYFSKNTQIISVKISINETYQGGLDMAKTGIFIVINSFIAAAVMYIIRSIIIKKSNIILVGLFQSVWTISTLYLNLLLNAMLADYFPRLSKLSNDDKLSNKLINEQLEITLLTGTPMLIFMLSFGSTAINILYSDNFINALPILQWQIYASFMTLIGWPLGVIYLARNKSKYMLFSELIKQFLYLTIIYLFWRYFGFNILGIGFFISIFFTTIFVIYSVKKITSFTFDNINKKNIIVLSCLITATFINLYIFNGFQQYIINSLLTIFTFIFCFKQLNSYLDVKSILRRYIFKNKQ